MGFTWDLWDEINSSPLKIGLLPQKERKNCMTFHDISNFYLAVAHSRLI